MTDYYSRAKEIVEGGTTQEIIQKVANATKPLSSPKEAFLAEANSKLLPEYITLSALSGVDFFEIGRQNLKERKTFHSDAFLLAESFLDKEKYSIGRGGLLREKFLTLRIKIK